MDATQKWISFRVDHATHARLRELAERDERSVSDTIRRILRSVVNDKPIKRGSHASER